MSTIVGRRLERGSILGFGHLKSIRSDAEDVTFRVSADKCVVCRLVNLPVSAVFQAAGPNTYWRDLSP